MNWKLIVVLFFGALFTFSACDNDIDLTTDWESIPVVYGLINVQDTAHYLRVEKAFLDPETGAPTLAQIPDSLYYEDIVVQIQRTGATTDVFTLERVDGNLEGYVREDGIFASMPNYLYKLKLSEANKLQGGDQLKLLLKIGESQEVSAEITATSEYELSSPFTSGPSQFIVGFLTASEEATVRWRDDAGTSGIFDLIYTIHIRERLADNEPFENKEIEWKIAQAFQAEGTSSSSITYRFKSVEFYQTLASALDVNPAATRIIDSLSLEIIGGGPELVDYREIGLANTGITSSQVIPTYTNLTEGRGIFTSISRIKETGFRLAGTTKEELETNPLTADLNLN